jgi:predicted nucleic acid-binding protein
VIVYADTSALAKLILRESGTDEMGALRTTAETIFSAAIAYVELRATAAAAFQAHRIRLDGRETLAGSVEKVWQEVAPVPMTDELLRRAGDLAEQMHLRSYDAVHLAALLASGSRNDVSFACWDVDLRNAGRSLGYTLFPA